MSVHGLVSSILIGVGALVSIALVLVCGLVSTVLVGVGALVSIVLSSHGQSVPCWLALVHWLARAVLACGLVSVAPTLSHGASVGTWVGTELTLVHSVGSRR